ncbi:ANTAR domain-containing response regulator [Chloroflexus aggregans]|uniref:Response regulator receiver and ANTAR domain protein n=1 Tax=Chloroflexus aggregans (strain MD-66 / DSM 9485) TaxID=326427 RepID=B8G3Y6_CHLAD|nr:response regulator [Chloroflexus aggregans]ACL25388.1 response regulator receiver and ANTAR domain protein [Chloroflexus aggregans DSM 9485]
MTARLLIADDEISIRQGLRDALLAHGYVIVGEAMDGQQAVAMTRQLRPDLVLLDDKMPLLDGLEAATVISRESLAPVVLLTSSPSHEVIDRARRAGVFGYLIKPFRDAELMPHIEVVLARWNVYQKCRNEMIALRNRLDTRTEIERAKALLIERYGLSETEAFRRIQQLAMRTRKTMREVAQAILLTNQLADHS